MKFLSGAVCAILLAVTLSANAQALKFGHINSAELLEKMPEVKAADTALQKYQKTLEDLNTKMVQEYQTKSKTYADKMSAAEKELKAQELSDLEGRIQTFQGSAQDKLSDKKQELYSPILKKAEEAIKAVAKEKGYSYVFDTSVGAVIYAQDSDNIMALVTAKLGVK